MATQEERSASTRSKLVAVGRRLFAKRGYAATSLDDVTRAANLTKGAFYHHFADKQALFQAIFEALEAELVITVTRAAVGDDAWLRFRAGCRAFLEAALDPEVQRIVLRDAPAVLGWDRFREIDSRYNVALIAAGLRAAIDEGHLDAGDPATLAQLVLGTLCEGARLVAHAPDPRAALRLVSGEIDALLASRATPHAHGRGARPRRGRRSAARA
jgi:AcrR family transcriptional regulator